MSYTPPAEAGPRRIRATVSADRWSHGLRTQIEWKKSINRTGGDSRLDDRLLIRRACEGDDQAFRSLYDRHVDRIFRLAFRMTGDDTAAQECTQDAFVQAFRGLPAFKGDARFSTWIHTIAVNVTLNHLRRVKRHRSREMSLEANELPSKPGAADPTLGDRIRVAVNALPDIYRTVFLMHDLEGFKHPEIAGALQIAVGTSKARLSRARASLRAALGEEIKEYVP